MQLPVRYSGAVQLHFVTGESDTFQGAVVPITQRVPRVGEVLTQATHEAFLPLAAPLPVQGGFRLIWKGREYVPEGQAISLAPVAQLWRVRLVDFLAFYPQTVTRTDGPSIRLRIVARGALPFTVGSGLQDVQGAPVSSHVGFVEPGVKLHGGDVLTLDSGDKFTVVPPLQHDLLGDTVGLSWQGDQTVPNLTPDPTPDAPGKPDPVPGDDSYWHTP